MRYWYFVNGPGSTTAKVIGKISLPCVRTVHEPWGFIATGSIKICKQYRLLKKYCYSSSLPLVVNPLLIRTQMWGPVGTGTEIQNNMQVWGILHLKKRTKHYWNCGVRVAAAINSVYPLRQGYDILGQVKTVRVRDKWACRHYLSGLSDQSQQPICSRRTLLDSIYSNWSNYPAWWINFVYWTQPDKRVTTYDINVTRACILESRSMYTYWELGQIVADNATGQALPSK
jgi:hypothetical protein